MKATIYYRVRTSASSKGIITCYIKEDGLKNPHRISTGIICRKKEYDNEQFKGMRKKELTDELASFNLEIVELLKTTNDILKIKKLIKSKKITNSNFVANSITDLFNSIDKIIDDSLTFKGVEIKQKQKNRYDILKKHLSIFFNDKKQFKKLYPSVVIDFKNHLTNSTNTTGYKRKDGRLSDSTIKSYTILFLSVLKLMKKKRFITIDFDEVIFKKEEDTNRIFLNSDEIKLIEEASFSNKKLEQTRKLILIGYYTGQRISDWSSITKDKINKQVLTLKQLKTGTIVSIPTSQKLFKLLESFNFNLKDSKISISWFNRYARTVLKDVGIDEKIPIEIINENGQNEIEYIPKYQLFGSHTLRRSFATNLYLSGVSSLLIKAATGHKTEESFLRYIKASSLDVAEKLKQVEFFK